MTSVNKKFHIFIDQIYLTFFPDELFLYDEVINIIKKERVFGSAFLELSQEDLERWGMSGGPAKIIVKLIRGIKNKKQGKSEVSRYTNLCNPYSQKLLYSCAEEILK
nr:6984_t:CDS:2 [Entrophospora candida]